MVRTHNNRLMTNRRSRVLGCLCRSGLGRELRQHVLGDQARHEIPLVGQEKVMLQTSQVLDAEPSCSLQAPQACGRYPLTDRPDLRITTDQQRVRALSC